MSALLMVGSLRRTRLRWAVGGLAGLGAEVGSEVASAELVRRPPHRLARDDRVVARAAADVRAQIARGAAGQQDPPQHRPERLLVDVGAHRGGDRLGYGVGLLRGEATLLDREGRRVTGGEYGVDAGEPAVGVGADEAVAFAADAAQSWADKARQGDDAVDRQAPLARRDV